MQTPPGSPKRDERALIIPGRSRKTTILIVGSPALSRLIVHLFHGRTQFEIVGTVSGVGGLGRRSGRCSSEAVMPELIFANVKPVTHEIGRVVASIKQSSPRSKLILICPVEDLARTARKCGADAALQDEKLTGHLLRVARTLSNRPHIAIAAD
jgi:hypothetical protein